MSLQRHLPGSDPVGAAMLGAVVAAAPTVALAGNSGYALLQLGWAVFIISLGPAVTETEHLKHLKTVSKRIKEWQVPKNPDPSLE